MVDQEACGRWQQTDAIRHIDALERVHVLEDLSEDRIGYELHAAERQHLHVGRHSSNLVNDVVLEPVVVLEVQAQRLRAQVLLQILFVKNRLRHAFQVSYFLPIFVRTELYIVESEDLPAAERICLRVWIVTEEGRLRVD